MANYLHTPRNLDLIAVAADIDDLDTALMTVMELNGITDGGVASHFFSGVDWDNANIIERKQLLSDWLRSELTHWKD